jgi:ubiquitin C-terminal hydrolase
MDYTKFYSKSGKWKTIINLSDFELETGKDKTLKLFPDPEKLSNEEIISFRTDKTLRKRVARAFIRILKLYGYKYIVGGILEKISPSYRISNNIVVGIYSKRSRECIGRILKFLSTIRMDIAANVLLLAICDTMKNNPRFREIVKSEGYDTVWYNYLRKKKDCTFKGLKYTGNSCYQDSVLTALFALPIQFTQKNILEKDLEDITNKPNREVKCSKSPRKDLKRRKAVQDALLDMTLYMRGKEGSSNCRNLRAALAECPASEEFHSTKTQDAGEFLLYIFSLFHVEGLNYAKHTIYTDDLWGFPELFVEKETFGERSPMILIDSATINDRETLDLRFMMSNSIEDVADIPRYTGPDGKKYMRRIETEKMVHGDFMVFYAQRHYVAEGARKKDYIAEKNLKRNYTKILAPVSLQPEFMTPDSQLSLYCVIVHRSNHYTCYIRCGSETWYYYDDMSGVVVYIGTYDDMISEDVKPNALTEGVLYFYKN